VLSIWPFLPYYALKVIDHIPGLSGMNTVGQNTFFSTTIIKKHKSPGAGFRQVLSLDFKK